MSVFQEILGWAQTLPAWQSDAIARLLANPVLSANDLDDLYALLKLHHGIADPKSRKPKPLTADQIPAPASSAATVELHALKNMKNVNAVAANQRLAFGATGLTVIYGDNGSGKSGYSRVLKRACRARDQSEPVHPNANLPADQVGAAEADFEILVSGAVKDVHWINGKVSPPELSTFSIFDSRCARAYLDSEDDFSYVPYGLDVFEGLAKVCKQLNVMVDHEHAQSSVDTAAFNLLRGETTVGRLIEKLSGKTDTAQIEKLASLSPEELARHAELEKSLSENNPKEKAAELRTRSKRIAAIASAAANKSALVGQQAVNQLKELADSYRLAQGAAAIAAEKFKENDNLLPGTGGPVWRELFEAAKKFALESYPDKEFPNLGTEAPCPLCQQPLEEGAQRLVRFEAFIQEEAEKTAQIRRKNLADLYKPFVDNNLTLNLDDVTYSEIESLDAQLAVDTREFEKAILARQEAVKAAIISQKWEDTNTAILNPFSRLQALAARLNAEAETLEKMLNESERLTLQKQFNELKARIALGQIKSAVLKAVERLDHQAKLSKCLPSLKTHSISRKSSEIAEKVVSNELAAALNREFKELGVHSLKVTLRSRSDRGKALHKLKLELQQAKNPADILSEGEQRAIAIASFLAETGLNSESSGIVFDDPVSSLDHRRRERVARRLTAEAAKRQVVIFTHDIYFLCVLVEEAERVGAPITTQSLTKRPEGFGVPDSELPFEGKNTGKRIGALKAHHQQIAKLFKDGDEPEHRRHTVNAYTNLRLAWERAVEEALLRNVVLRFRKGIETQRLAGVVVEDSDYTTVYAGMTKCSNYAHDKASAGGVAVPDPDELLADIEVLETWRKQIDKRSTETAARRKG